MFVLKSAPALPGPFQRFEQEEDFGGHRVVQIRGVGEGAVAAAGDDGLEGLDESAGVTRQVGIGGQFCEKRRGGSRVASEEVLGHGEADAAIGVVILAAVAAVGEVAGDGLALRLCGGGGVSSVRLDIGEDAPTRPRLGRMAELRLAFDRPQDLLPRFVEATELAQRVCEVVPYRAFFAPGSTDLSTACRKKAAASSGRLRVSSYKIPS